MTKKQTPKAARRKKVNSNIAQPGSTRGEAHEPRADDLAHDDIACRAHHIWLESGCKPGCEHANWLEAERQLRVERLSGTQRQP